MQRGSAKNCNNLLWYACTGRFFSLWGKSKNGLVTTGERKEKVKEKKRIILTDKKYFFPCVHKKKKKYIDMNKINDANKCVKILRLITEHKLHITYYSVFFTLFSIFSYCVVKLLVMVLNEPIAVKMVKEKVLSDNKLIEEYENVIFSPFWTGHINDTYARIIINIKSGKNKDKRGKIISNLVKKNDDTWLIKTLTYYTVKKNENLQTDDLKTIRSNPHQGPLCPVDHRSLFNRKDKS
ncbi:hypothetical protein, conserved [Plasmodium gonderi]|uniref:Uncharacterized protein n=1 Tax=Plasmodium gonderi TaxID=77519 RepID=A0A1Y1JFG2_PLAGO|nr:hypothetical protein, conserved [Plasmodium gonderi]GAW79947.1 hypothetical protein, conserved [Plasmodium gonderi]